MVLRALFLLVFSVGCLPQVPVARLATPTRVAIALVVDFDDRTSVEDVPAAYQERLAAALQIRNLVPQVIPFADLAPSFATTRDTPRRLAKVVDLSSAAPIVVLVETKALFFSQLNGRYKWTVATRVTIADPRTSDKAQDIELEHSAILDFDHERESEALSRVAPLVADRVGVLLDRFLAGHQEFPQTPPGAEGNGPTAQLEGFDPIYFALIDRFANGDTTNDGVVDRTDPAAWHGGDLKGLMAHLDELASLGVRTLWLSPVFKSRYEPFFGHGAFHGYWTEDLRKIDPRFGDSRDLETLATELKRRGMKLVLDVVLNHVGYEAPILSQHPDWFHKRGAITHWDDPDELVNFDVHGLPDLAVEKEEVYQYLVTSSAAWVGAVHPDGFRLDAVKHIPLAFWKRYNAEIHERAGRSFLLLGEIFEGSPWLLAEAQRAGDFTAVFDFPLHYALTDVFCDDKPIGRLAATLAADRFYNDPNSLVTFLDNHDLPRILSACHGELPRVLAALTFMLTARGIPSLTYGTEVGLEGSHEPENRGDMRFGAATPEARALTDRIRRLLVARREHPALSYGTSQISSLDPDRLVVLRAAGDDAALIAVNWSAEHSQMTLPLAPKDTIITDGLTGAPITGARLDLPGHGVAVLLFSPRNEAGRNELRNLTQVARTGRTVRFEVTTGPTGVGTELFVVGLGPELGNWQPDHGLGPLFADGTRSTREVVLPIGSVFEYKLVARRGTQLTWESRDNRYLFVTPGDGPLHVELAWDPSESRAS